MIIKLKHFSKKITHTGEKISQLIWKVAPMPKILLSQEKFTCDLWKFYTLYLYKFLILRPLLSITFPQAFRISKNFGHPTLGSGGKMTFKRYLKSEQTDVGTHKRKIVFFLNKYFNDFITTFL